MSVTSTLTLALALSCGLFPAAEGSLLGLFGRGSKGIGASCGQEGPGVLHWYAPPRGRHSIKVQ